MRLPRLTTRRLRGLVVVAAVATTALLLAPGPGDGRLALAGIALIWLLCLATVLPFAGYVILSRAGILRPGRSRRPPRLPRVTARRLTTMVAVVATGFAGLQVERRWAYCGRRAAEHARNAKVWAAKARSDTERTGPRDAGRRRARYLQAASGESQRAREYERALWRPWLPVPDDPPGSALTPSTRDHPR